MIDLQKHKNYLWKYLLTYGNLKKKYDDPSKYVFPFDNIIMENEKTMEDYRNEDIKQKLDQCQTLEDIFDFISLEYKDFYFMEISSLLHDDVETYSLLLRKTYDCVGVTNYISKHNYTFLCKYANEDTKSYILTKLENDA